MMLFLILVLLVLAFGGLPTWGYHSWGYYPSAGLGTLLLIVVIVALLAGRW